jgi:hypothetical protein
MTNYMVQLLSFFNIIHRPAFIYLLYFRTYGLAQPTGSNWVGFLHENGDRIQSSKRFVLNKKNRTMDNVQKHNNCVNIPSSQTQDSFATPVWGWRKGKSRIWDSKIWSRVSRDSDLRMTALAKASSNCKWQTRPLVRESAPHQQNRNCLTIIKIWS